MTCLSVVMTCEAGAQVAALSAEGAVHVWNCTQGKEHTIKATLQAHLSISPAPGLQHTRILAAAYATPESCKLLCSTWPRS